MAFSIAREREICRNPGYGNAGLAGSRLGKGRSGAGGGLQALGVSESLKRIPSATILSWKAMNSLGRRGFAKR